MTMMDVYAAEVLPELGDLHRRAILELDDYYGRGPTHLARDLSISMAEARQVLADLRRHGVVDFGFLMGEDQGELLGKGYWLDNFGKHIRARLEAQAAA